MIGRFSEEQALFVAEFKALICYGGFDIGGGVAAPVVFAMVSDTSLKYARYANRIKCQTPAPWI